MWFKILLISVPIALTYSVIAFAVPSVTIDAGTLVGGTCNGNSSVVFFKGIPYALPPTGSRRFSPPEAFNQTYPNGKLNATSSPPACIQFGSEFVESGPTTEDCLFINIWTPANFDSITPLPVRVWIYGGSNDAGGISNPLYDGCNVPLTGAVFVSMNYRVGPLGLLALESAGIGGNQAIQDILLSLQWIQDNISSFGGDPDRILLHGQSAGAEDAWIVASLPQASLLIQGAIIESGGGGEVAFNKTVQAVGQSYAAALNCSVSDAACLQNVSVSDLQNTFNTLPLFNSSDLPLKALVSRGAEAVHFAPYVDGKVIPVQPSTSGVQVPSIFGGTSMDGALFVLLQFANTPQGPTGVTVDDYHAFITQNFGNFSDVVEQQFPISLFNSTPFPAFFAMSTVFTLASVTCEIQRGLNVATARGIPVWTYNFAHTPNCVWIPGLPEESLQLVGPTHTSEIPFVFGNTQNLPQPNGTCNMTPDELAISSFMNKAWTSMAENLTPSLNASAWPAYEGPGPNQTFGVKIVNSTIPGLLDFTPCPLFDSINHALLANATAANDNSN